jgi:hypothetical protein
MATNKKPIPKLRSLIRQVYAELKSTGATRVTTNELINAAISKHPKSVAQEKDRLFREAIGNWARKILTSDSDSLRSVQLLLPLGLENVALPVCIAVRSDNRKVRAAGYIETYHTTYSQLENEIAKETAGLKESIKLTSLKRVRDYLRPHMASKPDEPIGPVLARLKAEEEAAEAVET